MTGRHPGGGSPFIAWATAAMVAQVGRQKAWDKKDLGMGASGMEGQVAVITGGARGIGLAVARRLAAEGAKVALWDRDAAALEDARAGFAAAHSVACVLDITDEEAVAAAAAQTAEALGPADILVNNAGITGPNLKTWEYSPAPAWPAPGRGSTERVR